MKRILVVLMIVAFFLSFTACSADRKNKYTDYSFDYFDTVTTLVGYAESKEEFDSVCSEIKGLLQEYHQLYNIYHRYDGMVNLCTVNDVSDVGHQPLVVDKKIMDLLIYSKESYELTGGKMNIAMGSVLSIWHDYRTHGISDSNNASLPPMEALKEAAMHTDIEKVILDESTSTVYLSDPQMTLDVGAVAKGYAVEQIARHLEEKGISGYLLNVGGNIRCVGSRPNGDPWAVAIENPDSEDSSEPYISYLHLRGQSLVTSGTYQRYYQVDGVRYHHIIDPATLLPGTNFQSVSVLCSDSGKADALSTALFNMTYEEGLALVNSLSDVEALWVFPDGTRASSSGFENYTYDPAE